MTTASLTSLTPTPARWRVPLSLLICVFCVSGREQPAAAMRLSRMIMAPSCSAALLKKMFLMRLCEITASTCTPVFMMSPSLVVRSMTISAPVRSRAMSLAAMQMLSMARVVSATSFGSVKLRMERSGSPPTFSSAARSSGWNRMMSASRPT